VWRARELLVERKSCSGDVQTDLQLERIFCLRPAGVCPSLPLELQSSVCSYGSSVRDFCYANGCVLPLAWENRLAHGSQLPSQALAAWTRWACALSFPRFATRRPSRTNPPLCGIFPCLPCGGACYRRSIYGSGVHLQCAVVRLAPAVRWLSSGSSRQKMAFPPWLRILRCSYGETASELALHRGLHEVLSVPHRRWKSPL
jgi:hypothetical protein